MKFEIFLNFNDGKALDAAKFYANIFGSQVKDVMLYGDAPTDPDFPIKESERGRLMYAAVKIADKNIMFMDMSADFPVVTGGNITPCITLADHAEIDRLFKLLSDGGSVIMKPQKTFFSEYYAMLTDKFGVTWHIYVAEPAL